MMPGFFCVYIYQVKPTMLQININAIKDPPVLETERLILKPVSEDLRDCVFQGLSDREVRVRMKMPVLNTAELQEDWWQRFAQWRAVGKAVQWCAFLKDSGKYVSLLTLKEIDHKNLRGELGYSVMKENWRQGIGAEGAARLVNYAFEAIGLHSLFAQIMPYNEASQRIVKRLGFVKEAHFRHVHYHEGEFYDLLQFAKFNPHHL